MSTSYVGEVRLVGYVFAPSGWVFCDGRSLSIADYGTLFSLLGTTYGGDGVNSFDAPDLRGRVPVHQGQLPGGSIYTIAQKGGVESVALSLNQVPSHNHLFQCNPAAGGSTNSPTNNTVGGGPQVYRATSPVEPMNQGMLAMSGGSQPHENRQPFLAMNWVISLFGIYPSQS